MFYLFVQNFYMTWKIGPQEHIHSKPNPANFEMDEFGEIAPVQNPRIYVVYPQELAICINLDFKRFYLKFSIYLTFYEIKDFILRTLC